MKPRLKHLLVILCLLPLTPQAQETILISGRVTSEGRGVPYATLQMKGSNIGTSCNDAGEYELRLPALREEDSIVIRSIGFVSRSVAVHKVLKNGNLHLEKQPLELKTVNVSSYHSARHLLSDVVKRIRSNYCQCDSWSTFFYRDWRTVDDTLYLFDEAVMKVRRCPYSQYATKRGYQLDPMQREMESNLKTMLRHRLLVYDHALLEEKIVNPRGCDQMMAYADDEDFFDPIATPQASYALAERMLREHTFEALKEFTYDGEAYYLVRSTGPCRQPKVKVRYEYTIRKSDLALVRLTSSQLPSHRRAPNAVWVNPYYNQMHIDSDTSMWSYEVREGRYTLTRYYNAKDYRLKSHGHGHDGDEQHWQQCHEWVLTDFSLEPDSVAEQPLSVTPRTLAGAFGSSDLSADFWGRYNYIAIDSIPLTLLKRKFNLQQ